MFFFRWECDCHLRDFRQWLTRSNVPRPIEPVCQGPRRLMGIRVRLYNFGGNSTIFTS